ncbi:MAG: hypothetical protein ACLFM1_07260 [Bacteroidales bacterium]
MKTLIFTLIIVGLFSSLHAQNDYYYYNNGEQIFLEPYHKKKYIVVNSTVTSKNELIDALDGLSLTATFFGRYMF